MQNALVGLANQVKVPEFKNGDYIVFQNNGMYVLYHMSDNKLWRTEAHALDEISADDAEEIEGIRPNDGMARVIMSGHEHVEYQQEIGPTRRIIGLPPSPIDIDEVLVSDVPTEEDKPADENEVEEKELPPLESPPEPLPDELTAEEPPSKEPNPIEDIDVV